MTRVLAELTASQLDGLAAAVERSASIGPHGAPDAHFTLSERVRQELASLIAAEGAEATALVLRVVAKERRAAELSADRRIELVWTGPEPSRAGTRDTAVVARELFAQAKHNVLVSGYSVYNARDLLEPLAERMRQVPLLRIKMFLNVHRREGDLRSDDIVVRDFARRFFEYDWPVDCGVEAYYDPRSLATDPQKRAVLHAKCILVDDRRAFITSANLTDAAHHRNIELGVLLEDVSLTRALRVQFEGLVAMGSLLSLVQQESCS